MFFLDPESKYERIFEFETMFLSCLFEELLPFENCKMYRNVLKKKIFKWPQLPGKCMYGLQIWPVDALFNSRKWSK